MLASNEVFRLKYPKKTVSNKKTHKSQRCLSGETDEMRPNESFSSPATARCLTRCGKKMSTNRMVPMSMNTANSPRSRNAGASSGIKLANAPTVVMLPMSRGGTISLSTSRTVPPWSMWATKCRG